MRWAIWISGLPGSGKTTRARAAARALEARGLPVRVLELDEIRRALAPEPTGTDAERGIVDRALAYVVKLVTEAGVRVIVDAPADRGAWRDLARELVPVFAELRLACPLDVCRAREAAQPHGHAPAGIAAGSRRPDAPAPEVEIPCEAACHPELTLDSDRCDVESQIDEIVNLALRLERRASRDEARLKRRLLCV